MSMPRKKAPYIYIVAPNFVHGAATSARWPYAIVVNPVGTGSGACGHVDWVVVDITIKGNVVISSSVHTFKISLRILSIYSVRTEPEFLDLRVYSRTSGVAHMSVMAHNF